VSELVGMTHDPLCPAISLGCCYIFISARTKAKALIIFASNLRKPSSIQQTLRAVEGIMACWSAENATKAYLSTLKMVSIHYSLFSNSCLKTIPTKLLESLSYMFIFKSLA